MAEGYSSTMLDSRQQSCKLCYELDTIEMVSCDVCRHWFHFKCVGVNEQVRHQNWSCTNCRIRLELEKSGVKPKRGSRSVRTGSSTRSNSRRQQLALERVEEERHLRDASITSYLNSKYKTLEGFESDGGSDRSVEDLVPNMHTYQWINTHSNIMDRSNEGLERLASLHINQPVQDRIDPVTVTTTANSQRNLFRWQSIPNESTNQSYQWQNMMNPWISTPAVTTSSENVSHIAQPTSSQPVVPTTNNYDVFQPVNEVLETSTINTVVTNYGPTNAPTNRNGISNPSQEAVSTTSTSTMPYISSFSSSYAFPNMPSEPLLSSTYVTSKIAQTAKVTTHQPNVRGQPLKCSTSINSTILPVRISNVPHLTNLHQAATNTVNNVNSSHPFSTVLAPAYTSPSSNPFFGHQSSNHNQNLNVSNPMNLQPVVTTNTANYVSSGHQVSTATVSGPGYTIPLSNQSVGQQQPNINQNQTGFYQFTGPQPVINSNNAQQLTGPPPVNNSNIAQQFPGFQPFAGHQQFVNPSQYLANQAAPTTFTNGQFYYPGQNLSQNSPQFLNNYGTMQFMGRTLTPSQIAARQVVSRKLPVFAGEIEKFPAFLRAYEDSTAMCGYTDGENLGRLRDSIKGDTFKFVEQQLLYSDSVPQVIETLKMLFGNPEFLIERLMTKIAKEGSPQADDLPALVKFCMRVQNICGTIRTSGLVHYENNPIMMKSLVDKLPPNIQLNWASYKLTVANPDLNTLGTWLNELEKVASSISGPPKIKKVKEKIDTTVGPANTKTKSKSDGYVNAQVVSTPKKGKSEPKPETEKKCAVCDQKSCKQVKECKKFIRLELKDRWATIKEKRLCLRCLGSYNFKSCKFKSHCNVGDCKRAHHYLLHENQRNGDKSSSEIKDGNSNEKDVKTNCLHQSLSRREDIFRIAPVILHHNGQSVFTYVYLDDGSNITMIEDDLATELDLPSSTQENLCVKWSFGGVRRQELISKRVSVQISGVHHKAQKFELHNVRTVNDLALPSQTIRQKWLDSYKHLKGIPITTYDNVKPRMLIGLQYSKLMVSQRTIEGQWSEPIACKTRLGWIVQGPDGDDYSSKGNNSYSVNVCECQREDDSSLHSMVKEIFSWDNFGVKISNELLESKDVQRARKILESTTKKVNGRYETGLLWRFDAIKFPESYPMALKRLECLERKMAKDSVLAGKMVNYIQDFIEKKYVRKLTPEELLRPVSRVFYLPIFPVFNPKKPEKFRVVWDAAALVNKISLNAMLLAGPDLLKPLPDVIRRFRERPIAVTGDMKEMFHQVRVIESDIHSQRFLWRDGNSQSKPEVFVIEVLTFGGKNSPCSAQFVKNKNALEHNDQFPRAVNAILDNHYQDDMLVCFDTIEEAVRVTKEVKLIHQNGGFEMRNFMSNSGKVLEELGEKLVSQRMNLDISTEPAIERVLGMFWNTSTDIFTFSLKFTKLSEEVLRGIRRPTKREVLSALMSIFDPLGLIAHYLVYGKILLQKIWRDGTNWDEEISDLSYKHWLKWIEVLPEIEKIEIPRWYSTKLVSNNPTRVQLHMFVDASVEACAAAVYYRIEDKEGVDCCLIGAKTKVAPNKPLSVPRLELQAAVLGLRLVNNISQCQKIQFTERFFWSDSQTVLGWINSEARKFHQYVAFRIGEILENSSTSEWNWVDTKSNVADDATKWVDKPNLSSTARWYKAPSFLYQPQHTWHNGTKKSQFSTDEEMRAIYLLAHIEIPNNNIIDAKNFSNWNRLLRAMAFALRFIDNSKLPKNKRRIGPFTREEYIRSRNLLFKQAQRAEFLDEIFVIQNNESLPVGERQELHKSSVLRICSPYLDEDGLLRIRGRIDAAQSVAYKTKRPIILPRNNYITKLLVYSYHQKFHHVNHQATLNQIKQTFYIPALRVVLKSVIENLCQRCKNDRAKPAIPEMAELPPERLSTFTRPFTYVGVDYFGPLKVKVRRTPEKRWGVIFTCLTTRAVYIEIAHSYDTSSCIFCIRNFENRNGPPLTYYSDNGTNFQGAEGELREEFQKLNKVKLEETFTTEHTQWLFNPPTAAHMGGVWERPIRTIKSVLKKLMPTRLPTDEMLRSYLIEIENIVNSIPLTYVQLDNVDEDVLTPNHFLKGSANGMKSPGKFNPKNLCRDDWKAVQEMTNQFWRQFVVEYIPTLTRRTKWFTPVKQLEVGDLVIDCDEDSNRNEWRKVVIEKIVIGKGDQVRRAKVRMIRGSKAKLAGVEVTDIIHQSLWRPAAKLALLDVKDNQLSSSTEAVNGEGNVVNAS